MPGRAELWYAGALWVSWLQLKTTGETGGLKWQCSAICHISNCCCCCCCYAPVWKEANSRLSLILSYPMNALFTDRARLSSVKLRANFCRVSVLTDNIDHSMRMKLFVFSAYYWSERSRWCSRHHHRSFYICRPIAQSKNSDGIITFLVTTT